MSENMWDQRYFDLVKHVSRWSKDPNAQVGAVITDKNRRVVALGYNGFPVGVEDSAERLHNKQQKNEMVVHAEENAILIADVRPREAPFTFTESPFARVVRASSFKRASNAWLPSLHRKVQSHSGTRRAS